MLQFLIGTNFPFMRYRRVAYLISGSLIAATLVWLVLHGGPHYSVDFTGGTVLRVRSDRPVAADHMRAAMDAAGYHGAELQQMAGTAASEYMIRMQKQSSGDPFHTIQAEVARRDGA